MAHPNIAALERLQEKLDGALKNQIYGASIAGSRENRACLERIEKTRTQIAALQKRRTTKAEASKP